MQRTAWKVGESYIDCRGDISRLTTLQGEHKRHIAAAVTSLRLIKRLITILEMYYCRGTGPTDWLEILRDSGVNGNCPTCARRIV